MKKNIFKKCCLLFSAAAVMMSSLTSCNEEPDGSNLFSTEELTIAQMMQQNADLTAFYAILQKCGYDKRISTYLSYTCFAPVNQGVSEYLDSLYADNNRRFEHNGIQDAGSLETFQAMNVMDKVNLMSDSLCADIAKYHMSGEIMKQSDVDGESTCSTLLTGRSIAVSVFTSGEYLGKTSLNSASAIIDGDNEAINGVLHVCSAVIPRSDRAVDDQISVEKDLTIFYEALTKTGWDKKIQQEKKSKIFTYADQNPTDRETAKNRLYCPRECLIKWTVFAETNDVFKRAGIESFDDLARKCAEWYGSCGSWYDYINERNVAISTGTDYENTFNVVNMFVAYHILQIGMPVDKIVYEKSAKTNGTWNFCFGYEPQEYFETMLPHTLLKVWQLNPKTTKDLYLNRYRQNNTLTDELGTFGSAETHPIIFAGVEIDRSSNKSIETLNGYVHRIKGILKYDENAVNAQNERMRLDSSNFLYELGNNGIRGATESEVSIMNGGGNGVRVAFDNTFFDNIVCYNPGTLLRFCVQGAWRAYNSDQFQGWDVYDFAVRLPPVPTGEYELRIIYPPMARGGLMQYYIGTSPSQNDMMAIGIPFDARSNPYEDASMGYSDISSEESETNDYGVESDQTMHVRGYMRAPASFSRAGNNSVTDKLSYDASDQYSAARQIVGTSSCRSESGYGTMMLRRIITTQRFKQGEEYWLRIKNLINDSNLGWSFDFIELVPIGIVNSNSMKEDWY